ncbi:NAD/NADP transhydrogenase subunit beta [Vibrio metschnikovii]|uniref:NAD/NADP transhydrogenase subunit beta n=1 Tax=Vibrio metschnikovii TaxID=28172 RepID=UPI001C311017|nr:NAD/NADP transhydrogenase subunit beta [Vibrio metschnikovii]
MAFTFKSAIAGIGDKVIYDNFSGLDLGTPEWSDNLYFNGNIRRTLSHQSSSLAQRLIELLVHYRTELSQVPLDSPVCLLLPRITDKTDIAKILKAVQEVLLNVHEDRPLFCFPYGHASFLLALKRISALSFSPYGCWVLSLDTSAVFCVGTEYQQFEDIKTDSLLLAHIESGDIGLEASEVQIDIYSQAYVSGVESVMLSLASLCNHELTDICLTFDSNDVSNWQPQLSRFSPWITQKTNYQFNNLINGEMGASSGLLQSLILFEQQKKKPAPSFHALQLDNDPYGMAAGVLYRWHS